MISYPWYLLAFGILLVVGGYLLAEIMGSRDQGRVIDANMDDDEIEEELKREQRMPATSYVIVLGYLCILVSIGWRLLRMFR